MNDHVERSRTSVGDQGPWPWLWTQGCSNVIVCESIYEDRMNVFKTRDVARASWKQLELTIFKMHKGKSLRSSSNWSNRPQLVSVVGTRKSDISFPLSFFLLLFFILHSPFPSPLSLIWLFPQQASCFFSGTNKHIFYKSMHHLCASNLPFFLRTFWEEVMWEVKMMIKKEKTTAHRVQLNTHHKQQHHHHQRQCV